MQGRAYPSLLLCTVPMLLAYVGTYIAQLEPEIWAPRMLHKCILYSSTYIDRYGAFAFFFFFFFFRFSVFPFENWQDSTIYRPYTWVQG